jgi:hypothetical protein
MVWKNKKSNLNLCLKAKSRVKDIYPEILLSNLYYLEVLLL